MGSALLAGAVLARHASRMQRKAVAPRELMVKPVDNEAKGLKKLRMASKSCE